MTDPFDPDKLTPEQRARFEWALAEYSRVQERNKAPGRTTIAPALTPLIKHVPNPKSRLFARLLQGKPALPFPPPTSYSYPWYELIDAGFSDNVSLDGFVDGHGSAMGKIILNQTPWNVVQRNAAAGSLMVFSEKVAKTKSLVLNLWESLEAKRILLENPEWIVRHGRNPEFRLYLCRVRRHGRKELLMTELLQRDFSGGNPKIVRTAAPTEVPKSANSISPSTFGKGKPGLANRIGEIEREMMGAGNQTQSEWVVVECNGWCLEEVIS